MILKSLRKNKMFIFITIGLSLLYYIITGIQFWLTDYAQIILN